MTKLTARQEEVVDRILEGESTYAIAQDLGISRRAVQRLIARACVTYKVPTWIALAARRRRKSR